MDFEGGDQELTLKCIDCDVVKPLVEFRKSRTSKYGRYRLCKSCDSARGQRCNAERAAAEGRKLREVRKNWPPDTGGQRMCRDCEEWKPFADFSPTKHNKSGLVSYCRPCANVRTAARKAEKIALGELPPPTRGGPRLDWPDDKDGLRVCRDCEEWIPLEAFPKSDRGKSGHGSYCRPCMNERTKASYAKKVMREQGREVRRPEDLPEGMKRCVTCQEIKSLDKFSRSKAEPTGFRSYCLPCHNEQAKESKERLHGSTRDYHLKRRYGITSADVDLLIDQQGGGCAICKVGNPEHVDHDHLTGNVRGVLCFKCNNALGLFDDDPSRMVEAVCYVYRNLMPRGGTGFVAPEAERDRRGTWTGERVAKRRADIRKMHEVAEIVDRLRSDDRPRRTGSEAQ